MPLRTRLTPPPAPHARSVRLALLAATALLLTLLRGAPASAAAPAALPSPDRFKADIAAFLAADLTNPPPRRAIEFIGSSIFRQWTGLQRQMAPLPVFNRAFGGSLTSDLLFYCDQVVIPYEPRIIVYYCGSNDANAGRTAEEIAAGFREFVAHVRTRLPTTRFYYVSINRAPQKRARWDVVDAANRLVRDYCAGDQALGYIDVNPAIFDDGGRPRMELYQPDQLHFLAPAYDGFTALIRPVVERAWKQPAGE